MPELLPDLPPGVTVDLPVTVDEELRSGVRRVVTAVMRLGGAVGWVDVPPGEEVDAWLSTEVGHAAAGTGALVVVRLDGRVEALGAWSRFPTPVVAQNGDARKIMAHPDVRGRGLGRVLMRAIAEHARRAGVETLLLDTRAGNHGALALYDSLGWVEYGRIPDFIAVHEHRWDRVCLYLSLVRPDGLTRHGSNAEGPGASSRR